MKRILALIGLLGCALMPAFSVEEAWFSTGAAFGNTLIFSDGVDAAYLGALGVNISVYYFLDQNPFGMFARVSRLHPLVSNGLDDADNYDEVFSVSVGAAGRLAITDRFALYGGLELDCIILNRSYYQQDAASEADYFKGIGNIGIGGHIGIKYDITEFMYANIDCTLSYLFYNRTSIRSYTKEGDVSTYIRQDEYVKGYSLLDVKPYIGVGFNWYSEGKTKLGKPKR